MSKLKEAWKRRSNFLAEKTQAFRWVDFESDGFPDFSIDVYDKALWIESLQENPSLPLAELQKDFDVIFLKKRLKNFKSEVLSIGKNSNPQPFEVLENEMRFEIDFQAGTHPGLFLDQRDNRLRVLKNSKNARVLNLFCYTGSFSVAAFAGGAAEVLSVDLSKPYLNWTQRNLALNAFGASPHKAIAEDCISYLRRLEKRGERFDGIILDPPSFSRNKKGKVMALEKDLELLVNACSKLLNTNAWLLVSANLRKMDERSFERSVLEGLEHRPQSHKNLSMPKDFSNESYLHAQWIVI